MNFCTYFNSNYDYKGWICYNTLLKKDKNLTLYILCLDEKIYKEAKKKKNVVAIKLNEIEDYFQNLKIAKKNRTLNGYIFTLSPYLPLYIFNKYNCNTLFYTDADMAFWGDPYEILHTFSDYSLMACDHGLEPPYPAGRFNVGILGYRNDKNCKEFLNWWKDRCFEWCEATTLKPGMCGDQGYLNILHDEPNKFKNFLSCPHPGINYGPWDIAKHNLTKNENNIIIDNKYNLICYHYHEFKLIKGGYYPTGWKHSKNDKKLIYDIYYELIKKL